MLANHQLSEDVCADGFETFVDSQFTPCHINLLAGSKSQLAYGWDFSFIRRKGRMTLKQREKREIIERTWKIPRGSLKHSFQRAVNEPLIRMKKVADKIPVELSTDFHSVYPGALKEDPNMANLLATNIYVHKKVSSRVTRDYENPLFSVNYLDREIRKDVANHVRETTRYAREPNRMMDRMTVYLVQHNTEKKYRIKSKQSDQTRHWQVAGIKENSVTSLTEKSFARRPWWNENMTESMKILWTQSIARPKGNPKRTQAQFWTQ